MGIHNFYGVFAPTRKLKWKDLKGRKIGIDASHDIYRTSLGMKSVHALTDKQGNPTAMLNTMLRNIAQYKKNGVAGLVFIFDNPLPNPRKIVENARRRALREKAAEDAKEDIKEADDQLQKRTFTLSKRVLDDAQKLLDLLGITWIVAPQNSEAEQLGAALTVAGKIDSFITGDSDALAFGATSIIRRNESKLEEFELAQILEKYELTREEFVHACCVAGNDFAPKTPKIGKKTLLTARGRAVVLTDEQRDAYNYFMSECDLNAIETHKSAPDYEGAIRWLVGEKNFSEKRVRKCIDPLMKPQ